MNNLRTSIIQAVATILIMLASPMQAQIMVDGTVPFLDKQWKTASGITEYIEETENTQRFNIYGQRIDKNYKGIVIINGRKKFQR